MKILRSLADSELKSSLANRLRQKRFEWFKKFIEPIPHPLRILDVGGTEVFWEQMGFADEPDVSITLINLEPIRVRRSSIKNIQADARDMPEFKDGEFDIVFSNSVIEHVGGTEDQRKIAREIMRVGRNYFVQTPNKYFVIEPHFLFPFYQFLPVGARAALLQRFDLGWYPRTPDPVVARQVAESIRLLTKRELTELFPDAEILKEDFFGFAKSWIACGRRP